MIPIPSTRSCLPLLVLAHAAACGGAPAAQPAQPPAPSAAPPPSTAPSAVAVPAREVRLEIDAADRITSFKPLHVFGNNVPAWVDPVPVRAKIEAAGNFLLRIPGGSWGDVYHWNSTGALDARGNWAPSRSEYGPSKLERGYAGKYFPLRATDGDEKTAWVSNAETDYPNAQWMYLDLGEAREVDGVELSWGNVAEKALPYAARFTVQVWDPAASRQWMVYGAEKSAWVAVKPGVAGRAGRQRVDFPKTRTQYVRVLLEQSSKGEAGVYSIAELRVLADGRPISGSKPPACVASSSSTAHSGMEDRKIFGFEEYMQFFRSFSVQKPVPLVIVNFGTGTPEEAAAWVHYANKVRNYGIRYWEIGNELGGQWEAGGPLNIRDYARRYIQFYEAMKAADPSITIIAQTGYSDASNLYDGVPSLASFLARLAQDRKEKYLDAFSVHQYPNWNQPVAELLQTPAPSMREMATSIRSQLAAYPGLADVPVFISEFNTSDHVVPDISVRLDNGLWLAQYLGEFIKNFGPRGYATLWDVMNGGSAITKPDGGDHGYLQAEAGPHQYQERADYWTMKLLAATWAMPGESRDHQLVASTSSAPSLASYAVLRPDGQLGILLVNTDRENAYLATLDIEGFTPDAVGLRWSFDATNYRWNTETLPYHADPDRPPSHTKGSSRDGSLRTIPPYSIVVLRFQPRA